MSVTRWDPFNDLYQLQRAVNRMVGDYGPGRRESVAEAGDFIAPVDVAETEEGFEVQVDLPGMRIEDIEINVTGQDLVIKGERKAEAVEAGGASVSSTGPSLWACRSTRPGSRLPTSTAS